MFKKKPAVSLEVTTLHKRSIATLHDEPSSMTKIHRMGIDHVDEDEVIMEEPAPVGRTMS